MTLMMELKEQWREGREEGIKEGREDIIKNMLSVNIPLEQIIKVSGWSKNKILSLKNILKSE